MLMDIIMNTDNAGGIHQLPYNITLAVSAAKLLGDVSSLNGEFGVFIKHIKEIR